MSLLGTLAQLATVPMGINAAMDLQNRVKTRRARKPRQNPIGHGRGFDSYMKLSAAVDKLQRKSRAVHNRMLRAMKQGNTQALSALQIEYDMISKQIDAGLQAMHQPKNRLPNPNNEESHYERSRLKGNAVYMSQSDENVLGLPAFEFISRDGARGVIFTGRQPFQGEVSEDEPGRFFYSAVDNTLTEDELTEAVSLLTQLPNTLGEWYTFRAMRANDRWHPARANSEKRTARHTVQVDQHWREAPGSEHLKARRRGQQGLFDAGWKRNPDELRVLRHEEKLYRQEARDFASKARRAKDPEKKRYFNEYAEYYNRLAKQRAEQAKAVNPSGRATRRAANPSTASRVNANSRMFHGEHNRLYGQTESHPVSRHTRGSNFSRLGNLIYLKMRNRSQAEKHNALDHHCEDCSIVFKNPRQSMLGMTPSGRLVLLGQSVASKGRWLRQQLKRSNPEAAQLADVSLGLIETIGYQTDEKHSDSFIPVTYYHTTAEETGLDEDRPELYIDGDNMLFIPEHSGNYSVSEDGIIN